jgi:enoyl-CoA hydratase
VKEAPAAGRVLVETDGAVSWVTIDNPAKRNALSVSMMNALGESVDLLDADPSVRVIVLRGAGTSAFAAGADISEFEAQQNETDGQQSSDLVMTSLFGALTAAETPVIAMIHGYCLGGGVALALGADIRIAADNSRFAIPAARLGVGYPLALAHALVGAAGPGMAAEILFTGRMLSADEALRTGLVNRLLPAGELEGATRELAATIAANAPLSVRAAKASIGAFASPQRNPVAESFIADCGKSADAREGQRAFMDKRRPSFTGA